jgi:hypothetical protein
MQPPNGPPPGGPPRFLRQFALTQGRSISVGAELPLEALVSASWLERPHVLTSEQNAIHHLCSSPHSIAEIASHLRVHLGIARVLVGDMVALGLASVTANDNDEGPDITTLERLLRDLQQL